MTWQELLQNSLVSLLAVMSQKIMPKRILTQLLA